MKTPIEFISARMVANVTGINYSTVLRHIRLGVLPAKRKGSGYEIRRKDMRKYARMEWELGLCLMYPAGDPQGIPLRERIFIDHDWRETA